MRFLVLLIFLSASAFADKQDHTCQGGHNCNEDGTGDPVSVDVRSDSRSSANQSQEQSLIAGDAVSEGGDATSEATGGSATTGPVSVSTEFNYPRERSTRTIKNTPSPYAPSIYPTVPCFKPRSLSFVFPGAGGSAGSGRIDPGCVERENVRLAPTEAHRIRAWCNLNGVSDDWESLEKCIGYGVEVEYAVASAGDDEEYKKVVARLAAIEAELEAEREARQDTEKRIQQTEQRAVRRARSTREYPENEALRKLLENKNDP